MRNGGGHHARSVLPLECRALTIERNARRLLDGVDLGLEGGGVSAVLGANGAGKSLLLRALAGLIRPDRGTVSWAGTPPERARVARIGLVFQKPVLLRRSVLQNMTYGLMACGVEPRERAKRAEHMLGIAGLSHLARTPARVLSGGEQQRLAMARALAMEPEVLLLDEPTSSLDPASTLAIEALIERAASAATKIVLVTHDLGQVRRLAEEVVFLHHGRVVERAATTEFCAAPRDRAARAFVEGRIPL